MKINPVDKQQLNSLSGIKAEQEITGDDFKKVLKQTAGVEGASSARDVKPSSGLKPASAIPMRIDKRMDSMAGIKLTLDHLERYRHLLSDTNANLRALEPTVRQLKSDIGNLEAMMDSPDVDEPAKAVISEALMVVSKEVLRFEQGEYVDR